MKIPRVLVYSNDTPIVGLQLLDSKCIVTILRSSNPTRRALLKALPGYDAVFLDENTVVDSEFLDAAGSTLKIISTMSSDYDHLNIAEIKRRGIQVGHTPHVSTPAIADNAIMLLLSAARRSHEGRLKLLEGSIENRPQWFLGMDVKGSTIGIVGLGNIGQAIAKRLLGFEVEKILYTGHSQKKAGDELGAEFVSLDKLLKESDFVIAATPLTIETFNMFNDDTFEKMKKNAVFVNVGRGRCVDTDALVRALRNQTIFAAGLDVFDPEPLPIHHELFDLPNLEISPHSGTSTIRTRNNMSTVAAQNILNALDGKPMIYPL